MVTIPRLVSKPDVFKIQYPIPCYQFSTLPIPLCHLPLHYHTCKNRRRDYDGFVLRLRRVLRKQSPLPHSPLAPHSLPSAFLSDPSTTGADVPTILEVEYSLQSLPPAFSFSNFSLIHLCVMASPSCTHRLGQNTPTAQPPSRLALSTASSFRQRNPLNRLTPHFNPPNCTPK